MVYITVSVVNPVFVITWLMVLPVPPEKPLRFPLEVAVQEKAVPATDEESRMDAVFPEQMV
jgi:pilus assembly protein TadC